MNKASWRFVDTRGKSNRIYHEINMVAHFKALKNMKPRISLNTPPKKFMENLEERDKKFVEIIQKKEHPYEKFHKKLAYDH